MSNTHITQYWSLLLDQPILCLMLCSLNPATLMPNDHPEIPLCHCEDLLDIAQVSHSELQDTPPPEAEADLFIHKHSLVVSGVRRAAAQRPPCRQDTSLAAGHIGPKSRADCFHLNPLLGKGQMSKHSHKHQMCFCYPSCLCLNLQEELLKQPMETTKKFLLLLYLYMPALGVLTGYDLSCSH